MPFWTAENHRDLIDETVLYSEPGRSVGMRTILDNSKVMAFLTFRGEPPSYEYASPLSGHGATIAMVGAWSGIQ